MGNECSQFNINKICPIENRENIINIDSENGEIENKNENNDKKEDHNIISLEGIVSVSSKKIQPFKNALANNENNLTPAQLNLISNSYNFKPSATFKKKKTTVFSELMSDFSFNNFGINDKDDIFETNYITLKDNYNEETLNYLNKIRNQPKAIIEDIDNLLKKESINREQNIQIENDETHENIIFEDQGNALRETKIFLNNIEPIKNKFNLNDDLLIDTSEFDKIIEPILIKKITKILIDKRKNIINQYPNCQFFVNFIKDIKINILYLLSENEDSSNFKDVIFNSKFSEFNVTWIKEKKNNFISFLCFA